MTIYVSITVCCGISARYRVPCAERLTMPLLKLWVYNGAVYTHFEDKKSRNGKLF
jgi:hypothetical protein